MPRTQKSDAGKQSPAKSTSKSTPPTNAKKAAPTAPAAKATAPVKKTTEKSADTGDKFLQEQRTLLLAERAEYTEKADELKAEADLLALESEPGDIQFDEEGGEGGTSNVERELDLVLSAQARAAVDEIDRALAKIDNGTYGTCETCGQPIPRARLKALPYAALCVQCKSGGLSRR